MKLSIITINYNNRDGLQRTINSVLCQTWSNYEWILVDGGSTDGSKELLERYQMFFSFWCSEPDKGIYNAMNKGITHANGEYLLFLNSGDCFHNKFVLEHIDSEGLDKDIVAGVSVSEDTGMPMKKMDPDILRQLFFDSLNHQATFINKTLFKDYQYNENNKIASDWEFFIRAILLDGCTFRYSNIIVSDFDTNGISNQSEFDVVQKEERKKILSQYFSPYLRKDILRFFDNESYVYYQKIEYMQTHSEYFYILGRKINSLLYLISKKLHN